MPNRYVDKEMHSVQANLPRLVVDFPFMKIADAERLEFNCEYL